MPPSEDWALPGTRRSRQARLYGTAARVLSRYGAARLQPAGPRRRKAVATAHDAGAHELYRAAVSLRGGFLKLGQFVSARPDLLPEPYVRELSQLQDRVPPAPASVVRRVFEEDVGSLDDAFAEFDLESASAASLAQVHRGVRHDGRVVAVKVQYPQVADIVPREAADTRRILDLAGRMAPALQLGTIGRALEHGIREEVDYVTEAANIERFAANFADEPAIDIPRVHHDLSRGRVLVMDWIEGENLARALRLVDHATAEEAARLLVDAYLKQILVDGFLHADPHPGNFLLQDGPRLGFVDFGACSRLSDETRQGIRDIYAAGITEDIPALVDALYRLGFRTRSGDLASLAAWASLFSFEDTEADREKAWASLIAAAREDPLVSLPGDLVMLGRVLIVQTGLVASINPSWDMVELIEARLAQGG